MRNRFRLLMLVTIWLVIQVSCSTQKINQTSSDRLYKKNNNELNAKYLVYHINDTISQLFYDISNDLVIYKKTDTSNYFYSDIRITTKISLETNLSDIIDTTSIMINDRQSNVDIKQLKGSFFF